MSTLGDLIDKCNDDRRRRQEINLGRCAKCGGRYAVNDDNICMACEFVANVEAAFPKAEFWVNQDGIQVVDLRRVDFEVHKP
jgi:hypothetical protein